MGVMIHYELQAEPQSHTAIRQLVEELRTKALELPFTTIGDVVEFKGTAADFENYKRADPLCGLRFSANEIYRPDGQAFDVKPVHIIVFSTIPGNGCEAASFGLALHSDAVENDRIQTKLQGWYWRGYCSTDRASNPDCGGMENFLRCHLAIVQLLDHAAELGILKDILDEGGYWSKRNINELAAEVTRWNCLLAGITDESVVESEIAKLPTFGYLDAEET